MNAPLNIEALAGTPNWQAARRGLLTASRIKDILPGKRGAYPATREKLLFDLLAERATGIAVEHYVTPAMQWGTDNQAGAISSYEVQRGVLVGPEAFVLHPNIDWTGATPDGFVSHDALIEVKCPLSATHLRWRRMEEAPEEHHPQMIWQLECTGRQWVDFVSFDPRQPEHLQMFVRRFEPTDQQRAEIRDEVIKFLDELAGMAEQLEL